MSSASRGTSRRGSTLLRTSSESLRGPEARGQAAEITGPAVAHRLRKSRLNQSFPQPCRRWAAPWEFRPFAPCWIGSVPDLSFAWARAFVVVAGLAILAGRAIHDVAVNAREASRVKEYAFLVLMTFAAVVYGIIHDHITATISPEYFLGRRRLRYRELVRLALPPLAVASVTAAACGVVNVVDPLGLAARVGALVAQPRLGAFMFVWGVHFGSYVGALVGAVWATWRIVARRRGSSSSAEDTVPV